MRPESRKFLFDIQCAANLILGFVEGKQISDYGSDDLLRSGVERQFEIIGEALSKLTKIDLETANRISETRRIVAFRNVLVHGYDAISDEVVWDIVQNKLPTLKREADALLGGNS